MRLPRPSGERENPAMERNPAAKLRGLTVVVFESRRARELARLIRKYGGEVISAPALREVPLDENRTAVEFIAELQRGQVDFLLLLTGVGTRTLVAAAETHYPREEILSAFRKTRLVARGPKPVAALRELGLRPDITVPAPNTWRFSKSWTGARRSRSVAWRSRNTAS